MKVAFLCGYPFVEQRFGVSEYVYQLCRVLAQRQVTPYVLSMSDRTSSRLLHQNVWAQTVKRKGLHYACPWLAVRGLKALVRQIDPDVVHLHGTLPPYSWAALGLAKQYPILVTVHGDAVEETSYKSLISKLWARAVSVPLMKQTLARLNPIVVLSSDMKARSLRWTRGRVYVVPGGIDMSKYEVDPPVENIAKFSYVLYLGALERVKGPDLLVRALSQVMKQTGPILVYFAGTGEQRKHLEGMVRKAGLEDYVRFLGFVSGSQKTALIQRAGFLVVPSRYESFGIVLLEAMACGKPVIAARVGSIPEIVRHEETGLVFCPGNTAQLAEYMVKLVLSPKLRLRYGSAARRAAEAYTWPDVGNQMTNVYQECIAHFKET